MQKLLYNAVYDAAQRYPELEKTGELAKYLPRIEELCGVTFNDELPLRKQLWRLSDKIAMTFTEEECDHYTFFSSYIRSATDFRLKKSGINRWKN